MREYVVEFDSWNGTGTAYYYARSHADARRKILADLQTLDGGHADVYLNGELVFDVESD